MRIKKAAFSVALLKTFLATGNVIPTAKVTADGWPEDARVLSAYAEGTVSGCVVLILESDTFEEVPSIEQAPYLTTTFERLTFANA